MSSASPAYDVVVVGARAAGSSAALLLAREGARVLVLDQARPGTDALSTHALMRAGVVQLSRWGVLDQVVAAGTPPVRSTTFHCAGADSVRISIRPSGGIDALYAPRRYVLDALLADAAAGAGAELRRGARVVGLVRDGARVTGVRVHTPDGDGVVTARLVLGADGISSAVAKEVAPPVVRRGLHSSAVRYAYFAGWETDGYEWAYGDGAGAGIVPTNDGLCCVFVSTTPERMRTLRLGRTPDELFEALFAVAAPGLVHRLAAAQRTSRYHGWAGAPGYLRRPWGQGWALVGDAGYYKDPIGAHGLTDAFRDAELVAQAATDALSGARSEAGAFADYQDQRDALSARLFQVTDEIASYAWDGRTVQPLLRRLSAAMTDEVELVERWPRPDRATDAAAGPAVA